MKHVLFLGLGYTAGILADRLKSDGWQITGTSRSKDGARRLTERGYRGVIFDGAAPSPELADALATATHIVTSIPPEANGDPVLQRHEADLARAPQLGWVGYLSSIGVYGDWQGAWIDETTEPRPTAKRSQYRLDAERAWLTLGEKAGKRVQVFRLPGIYGPGRSAVDNVRAGTARRIIKPGQVFNRIHVADIATAVGIAMNRPGPHAIYNLTDDEPTPPQDPITYAAQLLGVEPPPEIAFADAGLSPMGASFYDETKRVRNTRMKDDLGVRLAFPTYREGLADITRK